MRIAFVVHKYPPESLGGVETYTWSLARVLAGAGHHVHVFYPVPGINATEAQVERDGVYLWRVPLPPGRTAEGPILQYWHTFRDARVEASFVRFLAETRPDVVHFQHVQGVSARLIPLAAHLPRVATLHDYWFFCATSQLARPDGSMCAGPRGGQNCVDCLTVRPDLHWLRRLLPLVAPALAYRNSYLREAARLVPTFIAPSEFLREQYVRQGFPAERFVTLECGLDAERLTMRSGRQFDAPPGHPHFGFLGALSRHKGVHVLIEAFNSMPESAALTIYGREDVNPTYVAQCKAVATHPHIHFSGQVDPRYVGEALQQLDCLVVPSLWYENSPLVIQEAYGVGIPVIASRLGALAEKVRDGETGRLFAPGNSADLARVMRDLANHPEQLAAWRANVRPAPSMRQHAKQLLEIYSRQWSSAPQS